ncbi:hypothetical protein [Streptomyces sp. NPDC001781]
MPRRAPVTTLLLTLLSLGAVAASAAGVTVTPQGDQGWSVVRASDQGWS